MSQQDLLEALWRVNYPKLILVGQQPKANDPMDPLSPDDPKWSGRRLVNMMRISHEEYRRVFHRINLTYLPDDPFGYNQSTRNAARDILQACNQSDAIIALGRTATRCFGFQNLTPLEYGKVPCGPRVYHMPHPSGINRWYNDPTNTMAAAHILRMLYESYCKFR